MSHIENSYAAHAINQIKGFFKQQYGSSTVVDSNPNLFNLCLLKDANPEEFVCEERRCERKMLSAERAFKVTMEVMTMIWIVKLVKKNKEKKR